MSARWYLECGAHVDLGNGHGCYRPGGIYWWNQWRKDVKSWMKVEKVEEYYSKKKQRPKSAHDMEKSSFTTYQYHLAGEKYLLQMLVQLPILAQCCTAKPKLREVPALKKWIDDLQRHKQTDEYKNAVKKSQPADLNHSRLSQKIWMASRKLSQGKALAEKRDSGAIEWASLNKTEQQLVEAYDYGRLDKELQALMKQKTPPQERYKGVAASVAEQNTKQRWRADRDRSGVADGWSDAARFTAKRRKVSSAAPPAYEG